MGDYTRSGVRHHGERNRGDITNVRASRELALQARTRYRDAAKLYSAAQPTRLDRGRNKFRTLRVPRNPDSVARARDSMEMTRGGHVLPQRIVFLDSA